MDNTKSVNLPDLSQACTLTIRNPFVIEGADGAVTFCREPRDASEKQLQLRILARCCPDPVQLVPLELRDLKRWVCWKLELDHDTGKIKKPPYSPRTGQPIAATVKYIDHFVTFAEAHTACKKFSLNGVGFVFVVGDGFVGIDVDHAVEDGIINADVEVWLKNWFAETYQEFSPSGRGIHILGRGTIAEAVKAPLPNAPGVTVEIYSTDRYFTFTSQRISDSNAVTECQLQLGKLLAELNVKTLRENQGDDRPRTMLAIRRGFEKLMVDFAALTRPEDAQNDMLNKCSYYASRSFLAGALSGTEAEIQERLRAVARATKYCPGIEPTLKSGWKNGVVAGAFAVVTPEHAHDAALSTIDAWLNDPASPLPHFEESLSSLALLTDEEYATRRKPVAARFKVSVAEIDKFVHRRRQQYTEATELQKIVFLPVEAWPDPVDGAELLHAIEKTLRRFIIFAEPDDAYTLALWVAGTYCFEAFNVFPRICITSPAPECGKTVIIDCLHHLSLNGLRADNITAAVCFRVVETYHPTLLIDEFDSFIETKSEVVNILNSGHRKGGFVFRMAKESDQQVLQSFATFGPVAFAMIGTPTGTLFSRSHIIHMERKAKHEKVEDFDVDERPKLVEEFSVLRRKLRRWVSDNAPEIRSAAPDASSLDNRVRDNWKSLLKIATVAGGDWPEVAMKASCALRPEPPESELVRLLRDIRTVFDACKVDRISSVDLLRALLGDTESIWYYYRNGRDPLTYDGLSRLLATFDIKSKPIRIPKESKKTTKGFMREWFAKVWLRYLSNEEMTNGLNQESIPF